MTCIDIDVSATTVLIIDARNIVDDPRQPRLDRLHACGILAQSPDPEDRIMAREVRNALWATIDSETIPRPDMAQDNGGAVDFISEASGIAETVTLWLFGAAIGAALGLGLWVIAANAAARAQADLDRAAAVGAW